MRVSIVAALVSHSRLLSCKYHTQRLLLAKFLCLVIHIWVDRSRTRAPPLLMTPASNRQTHTSSTFFFFLLYCHSGLHMFATNLLACVSFTWLSMVWSKITSFIQNWPLMLFCCHVPASEPSVVCWCIYGKLRKRWLSLTFFASTFIIASQIYILGSYIFSPAHSVSRVLG